MSIPPHFITCARSNAITKPRFILYALIRPLHPEGFCTVGSMLYSKTMGKTRMFQSSRGPKLNTYSNNNNNNNNNNNIIVTGFVPRL